MRRHPVGTVLMPVLVLIACAGLVNGCGTPKVAPPAPSTPSPQERQAAADALAAYDGFWRTTTMAFAKPGAKNWRPELSGFATGQALEAVLGDVENYASVPAHKEGQPTRAPVVDSVVLGQSARVVITDCLDVRDVLLVADKTGADLRDTANQPPRYRYRAEVSRQPGTNRWLVEMTKPLLDQRC